VLVTGAGGSIGSELCRQLVAFTPGTLLLLDSSEANLYRIQMDLLHELGRRDDVAILGKVQDRELLARIFSKYRPDMVFHAAAYKHVPMLENNPWEAVVANVMGSQAVMAAAAEHGSERFVLVSTDKAVRPTNVMGATKRATEILMQSMNGKSSTKFMAVRFGNVIGSSGSVVPLFIRQIAHGGPVTVTHPEVTRYFMTITEACLLILQAGTMGRGGEIFILEMGTPVVISDMARDLVRLSGKEPDRDIEIVYTGLRPGEKLFEELITQGEDVGTTCHDKILVLRSSLRRDADPVHAAGLQGSLDRLFDSAKRYDGQAIKVLLKEIVPEYSSKTNAAVL
jgi:FlaA1/EpsC-like NDP-sugar epimerase